MYLRQDGRCVLYQIYIPDMYQLNMYLTLVVGSEHPHFCDNASTDVTMHQMINKNPGIT